MRAAHHSRYRGIRRNSQRLLAASKASKDLAIRFASSGGRGKHGFTRVRRARRPDPGRLR
jgi:hypothetical protein